MDDDFARELHRLVSTDQPRNARAGDAAELIRRETDVRWIGIYTVTDDMVLNEAWSGPNAPAYQRFPILQGLTAHAVAAQAIAVSNDVRRDGRYLTNQSDTGSELIVPVVDTHKVVGTLDVESEATGAFGGMRILQFEQLATILLPLWTDSPS